MHPPYLSHILATQPQLQIHRTKVAQGLANCYSISGENVITCYVIEWDICMGIGAQAYLAGLTFALAASPCSTPVLASLLGYVAASQVLFKSLTF
jgi:hypothetical protein